jgi:HSP20 family molecular chaperone IbpA
LIWDIDDLLNELGMELAWTLKELDAGRQVKARRTVGDDLIKVTTSVSIRSAIPDGVPFEPPVHEPLVDVFDDGKNLRVVVELPGVKKEGVRVRFLDGVLRIEVSKGGKVHQTDVPCKVAPGKVEVKSTTENNSVVEIVFLLQHREDKK